VYLHKLAFLAPSYMLATMLVVTQVIPYLPAPREWSGYTSAAP